MYLTCNKDIIKVDGKTVSLDSLADTDAYAYTDTLADKFYTAGIFDNELFLYFIQSYLILERYVLRFDLDFIDVSNADINLKMFLCDIGRRHQIPIKGKSKLPSFLATTKAYLDLWATFGLIMLMVVKTPFKSVVIFKNEFSIVRTPAAKRRVEALGIDLVYEDLFDTLSVYSSFKRKRRIIWTFNAFRKAIRALRKLSVNARKFMGYQTSALVKKHYSKRLVHTYLYENVASELLKDKRGVEFYTGNNLDRFAIIEERLCKKYNLKLITLPHGLEYGFKLPHGFTGDIFYTTSALAAHTLNHMYSETKYTFDQEKCDLFFKNDFHSLPEAKPRVVFFTEPREAEFNVNILDQLLPLLQNEGVELFLRLHPKDSASRYEQFDVKIMKDIKEALHNNVCFARKSTTLLEAVINGSKAAAILLNPKDNSIFRTFASLQIDEIEKCYDVQALFSWILKSIRGTKEKV